LHSVGDRGPEILGRGFLSQIEKRVGGGGFKKRETNWFKKKGGFSGGAKNWSPKPRNGRRQWERMGKKRNRAEKKGRKGCSQKEKKTCFKGRKRAKNSGKGKRRKGRKVECGLEKPPPKTDPGKKAHCQKAEGRGEEVGRVKTDKKDSKEKRLKNVKRFAGINQTPKESLLCRGNKLTGPSSENHLTKGPGKKGKKKRMEEKKKKEGPEGRTQKKDPSSIVQISEKKTKMHIRKGRPTQSSA